MTREEQRAVWAERLAAQAESGLSGRAWCFREGMRYATFNYWRGRLKAKRPLRPLTLIRLGHAEPTEAGFWITVGAARIEVCSNFDPTLLRRVVDALGS